MGGKHTNSQKLFSPNILFLVSKVFGLFLLFFILQFKAQLSLMGGAVIYDGKNEMSISQNPSDSTGTKIYVQEGVIFSGTINLSANSEIIVIEKDLDKKDNSKETSTQKKLVSIGSQISIKKEIIKVKAFQISANFKDSNSESSFTSAKKQYKSCVFVPIFKLNSVTCKDCQISVHDFAKSNILVNNSFTAKFISDSYMTNLSVRPPPYFN